jgi:hypothetical protein
MIRRHVSVDLTVPPTSEPVVEKDSGSIHFVPFALLQKAPLINFDLIDESGASLPLLTKRRNGKLATATLVALAESVISSEFEAAHGAEVPEEVERDLWTIAHGAPDVARGKWKALKDPAGPDSTAEAWRQQLTQNSDFMLLAEDLSQNFIAVTPLKCRPDDRRVLKFSYEHIGRDPVPAIWRPVLTPFALWLKVTRSKALPDGTAGAPVLPFREWVTRLVGWAPKAVTIKVHSPGQSPSYHLEVEAPDGLDITWGRLSTQNQGVDLDADTSLESVQRLHLYVSNQPRGASGEARLNLRPMSASIVRGATFAAALTTVLLGVLAIQWSSVELEVGTLPSLLLVAPGLLSAYVARKQEPSVTTQVLFGLRLLAFASAILAFVAAGMIGLGRTCSVDPSDASTVVCQPWSSSGEALWIMFGISAVLSLMWLVTWTRVTHPPEQKP